MERTLSDTTNNAKEWQEADSLLPQTSSNVAALNIAIAAALPTVCQTPQEARKARLALYASHFLSAWGQRAWEFTVGLVMLEIRPTSLFLVALFGLCDSGAQVLFNPAVGAYLDSTPRLQGACVMYALQNSAVAISAAAALFLLNLSDTTTTGVLFGALVGISIAAGSLSSVGASGATISVEREWTKTLAAGDSHSLAEINAGMKRIDLTCLIASPILVGLLMTWHMNIAVGCIVVYNLGVWWAERDLLKRAQAASPVLRHDENEKNGIGAENKILSSPTQLLSTATAITSNNGSDVVMVYSDGGVIETPPPPPPHIQLLHRLSPKLWLQSFVVYAQQPCAAASVSLALLYFTVMSFGTLMTAYLKWRGMRESILSIYRGLGAVSGLLATVTFPHLHKKLGLVSTGALSIVLQLLCVVAATLPAFLSMLLSSSDGIGSYNSSSSSFYTFGIGNSTTSSTNSTAPSPSSIFLNDTTNGTTNGINTNNINNNIAITISLVWGLVLSRFGLWSFDLAANQLIQENTDIKLLGTITGAQSSLQSGCQMAAYVAGAVVWQPERFPWLMVGSMAAVGVAAVVYLLFAVRVQCGGGGVGRGNEQSIQMQPLSP